MFLRDDDRLRWGSVYKITQPNKTWSVYGEVQSQSIDQDGM